VLPRAQIQRGRVLKCGAREPVLWGLFVFQTFQKTKRLNGPSPAAAAARLSQRERRLVCGAWEKNSRRYLDWPLRLPPFRDTGFVCGAWGKNNRRYLDWPLRLPPFRDTGFVCGALGTNSRRYLDRPLRLPPFWDTGFVCRALGTNSRRSLD
jgi:hypothetical protein